MIYCLNRVQEIQGFPAVVVKDVDEIQSYKMCNGTVYSVK